MHTKDNLIVSIKCMNNKNIDNTTQQQQQQQQQQQ